MSGNVSCPIVCELFRDLELLPLRSTNESYRIVQLPILLVVEESSVPRRIPPYNCRSTDPSNRSIESFAQLLNGYLNDIGSGRADEGEV